MKYKLSFLLFFFCIFHISANQIINVDINKLPEINNLNYKDNLFKQFCQTVELNDINLSTGKPLVIEFYSYKVKKTDTLFTIHSDTNIPYDTIASVNSINDINSLKSKTKIIIPTFKGIFINQSPNSPIEILISKEYKNALEDNNILCYNINNKVLFFLSNKRFTSTTRAFFLDSSIIIPIEKSKISSDYGMRINPFSNEWKFHKGIDFACEEGTPILACKNGKVITCIRNDKIFGNYLILSHSNNMTSVYAHLKEIYVKKDDIVSKGTQIGTVGKTGLATGPHLHFELRNNGIATDPKESLPNY